MAQIRTHTATRRSAPAPMPMPQALWRATERPEVVHIPARTVLALDGQGEPGGKLFQRSVAAVYGVGYTLKFMRKAAKTGDFRIGPLEGRWWSGQPEVPFLAIPRSAWLWQLRIAVPADVRDSELAEAVEQMCRKKGDLEEARRIHVAALPPQTVGRALHVGAYADEPRTIASIRAALADANLAPAGPHLEVYLSDPGRKPPQKLRTVLCLETKINN